MRAIAHKSRVRPELIVAVFTVLDYESGEAQRILLNTKIEAFFDLPI